MRFQLLATVASFASLAVAQYNGLPKCAQACVGNSLTEYGCGNIQAECICKNEPLIAALACCVGQSCTTPQEIADTQSFAAAICKPYDVTLPASATCASTISQSVSPTAGTSSPVAASASSTSSAPSSASASGALATGGAATNSSNGTAPAVTSQSPSGSSSTSRSTGGAPIQTMAAGLGAAAMGLLAVL